MRLVLKKAYSLMRISATLLLLLVISYPFYQIFSQVLLHWNSLDILSLAKEKIVDMLHFSLSSSFLSALFSLLLALLNTILLKKAYPTCRRLILGLLFLPFGIAPIVGTLSLVVYFGKKGQLLWLLSSLGLMNLWNSKNLYSYTMINFLNLLYNVPLLTLFFWNLSLYFPSPLLTKARLLGASRLRQVTSVLYPLYQPHLLAGFCLVFVYCYQSFFPVLFLGNKSDYLTSEILIYQQLSWNFSLNKACLIALLQIILLISILSFFLWQKSHYTPHHAFDQDKLKANPSSTLASLGALFLSSFSTLLWLPLLIKTSQLGMNRVLHNLLSSLEALKNSLIIAFSSSFLVLGISLYLLFNYTAYFNQRRSFYYLFLPFTLSPLLTSYFYQNFLSYYCLASNPSPAIILCQCVTQLPLSLYCLSRELAHFKELPLRAKSLGAKGLARWLSLDLPLFSRSYLYIFFLNLITSLGNLNVSALYIASNFQNLPLRINQLLNSYRTEEAMCVASLCIVLFFILLGIYLWINRKLECFI